MLKFLIHDKTHLRKYNENHFNCNHFATLMHNKAEKLKIKCAYVGIDFIGDPDSHAIVAFNTTDKGLIYIEPQSNKRREFKVGTNSINTILYGTKQGNRVIGKLIVKSMYIWWDLY